MRRKEHWDRVFGRKQATEVTWYQPQLQTSLALLERAGAGPGSRIIDVGCGTSTLVDDLLQRGFEALTVLDVSPVALEATRQRLGHRAADVGWLQGDVTEVALPEAGFDLWHDRAVFHFLTDPPDRRRYVAAMERALPPGAHAIIATFAEDGPQRCSGLETMRYGADELAAELGPGFSPLHTQKEIHSTPRGGEQLFRYCLVRRL
jgi:ubiquinone/menaquinone biosynthesis C-methylase UbiE